MEPKKVIQVTSSSLHDYLPPFFFFKFYELISYMLLGDVVYNSFNFLDGQIFDKYIVKYNASRPCTSQSVQKIINVITVRAGDGRISETERHQGFHP